MNHSGTITSNETWYSASNPHIITGHLYVKSGAILTIEPGCEIYFDGSYMLNIGGLDTTEGKIIAEGNSSNHILFSSNLSAPAKGDYISIYFRYCPTLQSRFKYVDIEYATTALDFTIGNRASILENITIKNCNAPFGGNFLNETLNWKEIIISACDSGFLLNTPTDLTITNLLMYNIPNIAINLQPSGSETYNIFNATIYNCTVAIRLNSGTSTLNVKNSIITGNSIGLQKLSGTLNSTYNDVWNNTTDYSGLSSGTGDISVDPKIINLGGTDEDDYRLKSQYGRWNGASWVTDALDSPCIDVGDPGDDYSNEPYGNGGRINMGFDGNTQYASLSSLPGTLELEDINNDFRSMLTVFKDMDNDFRMQGTESISDINNDFRTIGAILYDILNDFRMIGDESISDISNDCRTVLEVLSDIGNKFNTVIAPALDDILNKFNMHNRVISEIANQVNILASQLSDVDNDFRTIASVQNDVNNDFRMAHTWQTNPPPAPGEQEPAVPPPADVGFLSLGKKFVKVYINSVEQTDAIVDSISITKSLDSAHIASFELGRAYDNTKPNMELPVEIKYDDWLLYKGYIVDIVPTGNPESIKINCQDKYWKQNKTNNYFFVGHKPQDDKEKYYNTIKEALDTEFSFDVDIGDFIPRVISCFAQGESDCISNLIQNAGNFGWYYDENEVKKLWIAGQGNIIDLERQSIGTNLGLYQVIRHQFKESIDGIVNKLRVQLGEEIIKEFDIYGGVKTYTGYNYSYYQAFAIPNWNSSYEQLAKNSSNGYGIDRPEPGNDDLYTEVFKKYTLPYLDPEEASWTDRFPPSIVINGSGAPITPVGIPSFFGGIGREILTEGFTIDYENRALILNEASYDIYRDDDGEVTRLRRINLFVTLWKKNYWSYTVSPTEDPESDVSNPLMFFTDKMGDYSETILGFLDLSGLSIQEGITYIDATGQTIVVPSWNDIDFAEDYADWQLSKTCDKKVNGSINITLDAFCFYGIDLSKRIMIDGVIDNPLNISSITLNLNSFLATIALENGRYYKRLVSLQSRGE